MPADAVWHLACSRRVNASNAAARGATGGAVREGGGRTPTVLGGACGERTGGGGAAMTPPPVAAGVRAPQEGAATARGTRGMSGRADLASPPTSAAHSISLQTATSPRRPGRASRLPPGRRRASPLGRYKHTVTARNTEQKREVRAQKASVKFVVLFLGERCSVSRALPSPW